LLNPNPEDLKSELGDVRYGEVKGDKFDCTPSRTLFENEGRNYWISWHWLRALIPAGHPTAIDQTPAGGASGRGNPKYLTPEPLQHITTTFASILSKHQERDG